MPKTSTSGPSGNSSLEVSGGEDNQSLGRVGGGDEDIGRAVPPALVLVKGPAGLLKAHFLCGAGAQDLSLRASQDPGLPRKGSHTATSWSLSTARQAPRLWGFLSAFPTGATPWRVRKVWGYRTSTQRHLVTKMGGVLLRSLTKLALGTRGLHVRGRDESSRRSSQLPKDCGPIRLNCSRAENRGSDTGYLPTQGAFDNRTP